MPEASAGIGNVAQNKTLTEMAMGYARSRVLCAAARLGVADAMGSEERTVDQLAALCSAQPASLYRLLRALASFGVVAETRPASFVLTPLGQPLRKDAPNSEWAAIVFWADLLADSWSHLTECIRTGENAMSIMQREGIASQWSKDPNAHAIFCAVMGTAPAEDYLPIARAWDFSGYHTVADLGGGGGALIDAVLTAFPHLNGMLVDLPDSIAAATSRFATGPLAARCKLIAADLSDAVPPGADVYLIKHVLHGRDDEAAIKILQNCRAVLPATGRLLVIEFVLPDVVDHPDIALEHRFMSDLNMLAVTGGKERSALQWKALFASAGLDCRNIIPVPGELVSIVEGVPERGRHAETRTRF
ncbi:MAG TPA: methyltransferase [Acidobacteriaceae bacterium]|nr:methyltransferase [Acidobacteriaceae bacterium]